MNFYNIFYDLYLGIINERFLSLLTELSVFAAAVLITFAVWVIVKLTVNAAIIKITSKTAYKWDDDMVNAKFFKRLANLAVPFVFAFFIQGSPSLGRVTSLLWVWVITRILVSLLNFADTAYRKREISKTRPIKGLLQVAKIFIYISGGVCAAAAITNQNPLVLMGGIGAATAVTSLIFKDAILGFVAGIQLSANDMIRIGDWIEAPGNSADGFVTELTLTTVKVQNFDKTITSIPAYSLTTSSFINWRGMQNSGGRRIKRSIYIDAASISFCSDKMLERMKKVDLLKEYIDEKLKSLDESNKKNENNDVLNSRRLTNIGTFREYIRQYLLYHQGINQDMLMIVRQLDPQDKGIPLEIYAFSNTINWVEYEGIQADIFDRLYSIAPEFGLKIFQSPSGTDIRAAINNNK